MRATSALRIFAVASAALYLTAFAQTDQTRSAPAAPVIKIASDEFEVVTLNEIPGSGENAYWGSASPSMTLIEYGDFQCPFTKDAHNAVHAALGSGRVRVIFKPLPLDRHGEMAATTARYYVAVSAMFPERALAYADLLFANKNEIRSGGEALLRRLTQQFGVDLVGLDSELKDPSTLLLLRDGIREAQKLGFDGTPTFVVGNKAISGDPTPEYLIKFIESSS